MILLLRQAPTVERHPSRMIFSDLKMFFYVGHISVETDKINKNVPLDLDYSFMHCKASLNFLLLSSIP